MNVIGHRPLADIRLYEKNPGINDAAVDTVATSLKESRRSVTKAT